MPKELSIAHHKMELRKNPKKCRKYDLNINNNIYKGKAQEIRWSGDKHWQI